MKHLLMLMLTISLSSAAYANNAHKNVSRTAAPTDDVPSTSSSEKAYHNYDNSDTIQTGQAATTRTEYQYDSKVKNCRAANGTWLRAGDAGFAACMNNMQTLKK